MDNQILLNGISADELAEKLMQRVDERLEKLSDVLVQNEVEYLTRKQTAELLSISLPTLHDWCRKKILVPYRIGNRVYFKSEEISNSLKRIY